MLPATSYTPEVPEEIATAYDFISWFLGFLADCTGAGDMVLIDRDDISFLSAQWTKIKEKEQSTHD